jgi:hypothetical protein
MFMKYPPQLTNHLIEGMIFGLDFFSPIGSLIVVICLVAVVGLPTGSLSRGPCHEIVSDRLFGLTLFPAIGAMSGYTVSHG